MATWDGGYYNYGTWSGSSSASSSGSSGWGSVVINNAPNQREWYYSQIGIFEMAQVKPRSDAQQMLEGWDADENPA